jgi:hypothetical protein
MKKIDVTNYEEWIIDWLDGNLNDVEVAKVLQFLEEHQDIKEEFGEIELFRLKPQKNELTDKTRLQKSLDDLPETQFEYLCAASIEKDLSDEQQYELEQITKNDPDRKKTLELFRKTILIPAVAAYPFKKALYKRTVFQNAVRLSLIGLSAAAVIAIAFILYFTKSHELPVKYEMTSKAIVNDSITGKKQDQKIPEKVVAKNIEPVRKQIKNRLASNNPIEKSNQSLSENKEAKDESSLQRTDILIGKINIEPNIAFRAEPEENLISLNFTPVSQPDEEEGSKIGRFIAKTVREKILREKTPVNNPLKGYEIAQAGVAGLNKLMGWEMALDERKDSEGNLKSVYFSSKLLKFNAPVKKTEASR